MRAGQAGTGRGRSLGSREQAQVVDLDLVLPPGAGTLAVVGGGVEAGAAGGGGSRGGRRSGETGAPPSFLDKLSTILNEPRLSEHISWNQEGDGVVINKPDQFAKVVLPKYYKHSNYQSFVRQLNIYGFHKTRHDEDSCEFKQPNFRRGMPHLVGLIRRKGQGNNASAAGFRHSEGNNNNSSKLGAEEAKGMMDRVTADLRTVCNRVAHLEAEMGMINHRHNHLLLECQALLRVVLSEGGQPLAEKAVAALRQLPHVAIEPEMSELLPIRFRPEEQRQHYQHQQQNQKQRLSGPSPPPPPFQGSSGGNSGLVDAGGDAGLSPAAGLGARPREGANPPFSASGTALASVVAAAIADQPPPSHALPDRANARWIGNDGKVGLDGASQAVAATSPAPGGFPPALWPEAVEPRDSNNSTSGAGQLGGGAVPDSLHGGVAGSAGAESARGDGLGGAPSPPLSADLGSAGDGKSAPRTAVDAKAAATLPLLAEFSGHRGGSGGATPVGGEGVREQVEARHARVGDGAGGCREDEQGGRRGQQGADLESATRSKRKAAGGVD
eukprot:g8135.t1